MSPKVDKNHRLLPAEGIIRDWGYLAIWFWPPPVMLCISSYFYIFK